MSYVILTSVLDDTECCAPCLNYQLISFRDKIKEQWNRFISDGKTGIKEIPFELDPLLPWQLPCTSINGTPHCMTHCFLEVNKMLEAPPVRQAGITPATVMPKLKIPRNGN